MIRRPHRRSRRARQSVRIKPNCPPLSPSAPQPPPAPTRPPGAPPAGPRRYPAPMPSPPPTRPPALRRRRAAASEAAVQGPDAKATAHGHAAGHTELLTGRDRQAQVRPGHAGDVLRLAAARKGGARVVDRQVGEVVGGAVGLAEARLRRGKVGKERGATPDPRTHAHPAPPSPPPPGRALRRVLARPRAASSRAPPSRDVATAKTVRRSTSPRTRPTSRASSKSAANASVRGAPAPAPAGPTRRPAGAGSRPGGSGPRQSRRHRPEVAFGGPPARIPQRPPQPPMRRTRETAQPRAHHAPATLPRPHRPPQRPRRPERARGRLEAKAQVTPPLRASRGGAPETTDP